MKATFSISLILSICLLFFGCRRIKTLEVLALDLRTGRGIENLSFTLPGRHSLEDILSRNTIEYSATTNENGIARFDLSHNVKGEKLELEYYKLPAVPADYFEDCTGSFRYDVTQRKMILWFYKNKVLHIVPKSSKAIRGASILVSNENECYPVIGENFTINGDLGIDANWSTFKNGIIIRLNDTGKPVTIKLYNGSEASYDTTGKKPIEVINLPELESDTTHMELQLDKYNFN